MWTSFTILCLFYTPKSIKLNIYHSFLIVAPYLVHNKSRKEVQYICYIIISPAHNLIVCKTHFLKTSMFSHLFLPIGKVVKMSSAFFKNSDDSGILMEFLKNFDQNTGGKLEWQINQLILN